MPQLIIDCACAVTQVVFVGTLTSGGLKVSLKDGQLRIEKEGRHRKFVQKVAADPGQFFCCKDRHAMSTSAKACVKACVILQVFEKTFAAAASGGRPIMYVTERAVFRLRPGEGIELVEVAPGIDIEAQVLAQMDFRPIMRDVRTMDARTFRP